MTTFTRFKTYYKSHCLETTLYGPADAARLEQARSSALHQLKMLWDKWEPLVYDAEANWMENL